MFVCARKCISAVVLGCVFVTTSFTQESPKPKLVVAIIIDQFRYDYLTRFASEYHGGLHHLLTQGANFTNAFYQQVPTVTAVGHSIFMSGAMPAVSGIAGNSWYDRDEEKVVTSVCDWRQKVVGGRNEPRGAACTDADPASPHRLLVSTLGDEMRTADERSKVIGISLKSRASILPSGHRANGAYWFDDATGHFITSTYYMDKLPSWAEQFNAEDNGSKYLDRRWDGFPEWNFHASSGQNKYSAIAASPWGNELVERFAEQAVDSEQLGSRSATDLLTISFSSNDYVGHRVGPDAPEVRDMSIRTDQLLEKLFGVIDQKIGMQNVLVVLSADHGVAPAPDHSAEIKMPGGYIAVDAEDAVRSTLNRKYGSASWIIPGGGETTIYFDRAAVAKAKTADGKPVPISEVSQTAAQALLDIPLLHVARVYTRQQLENGVAGDFIAQAEMNGFNQRRGGDLMLVFEPNFVPGTSGTTHFSPWAYDRHVPLLFMGPGIKPGRYDAAVAINDVAPTVATMLEIQTPSGSSGHILTQMLSR